MKLSDFTPIDKQNLLDLFVNHEQVLIKIYEILFEHRKDDLTQNPFEFKVAKIDNTSLVEEISSLNTPVDPLPPVRNFKM